uniref:Pre-C2HC domain-containing protein n=1 Tax=Phlebotomus papatasi TaxID=29031 RepID=A0A1B0DGV8_PHLPP
MNIKSYLTSINIDYYTYTPKNELCKKMVLKGLDKNLPCKEILDDLQMQHNLIVDVKQMQTTKRDNETTIKEKIGVFVVYLKREANIDDIINNIKIVLHHVVIWEKFNKRANPATFCGRCSRWGHGASNCNMPLRCLKCGKSHSPEKCDLDKQRPPTCANCKLNHPATYRECPAFKSYIERRKDLIEKNRQKQRQLRTSHSEAPRQRNVPTSIDTAKIRQGISYADVITNEQNFPISNTQDTSNGN